MHAQSEAHFSQRIRVEHGITLKSWRALGSHRGRHEHIIDTVQAVAALLPDLAMARVSLL